MLRRTTVLALAASTTLLGADALGADVVVLDNGRVFEDVVAQVDGPNVRIRMAGGDLTLPGAHVARIEKGSSLATEYLSREAALRARGTARAAEWLELARWARAQGLASGARQAALAAAELDPGLGGLEAILRPAGYEREKATGRWIPYDEWMRRRGFVDDGGEWIRPEELAARNAARDRAQLSALELERARLERTMAEVQLARTVAAYETERAPVRDDDVADVVAVDYPWGLLWGGGVTYVLPGYPPRHPHRPPHGGTPPTPTPEPQPPTPPPHRTNAVPRVPGSLIPILPGQPIY